MSQPRPIGDIIAEIMADLQEIQDRFSPANEILSCKEAAKYIGKTPQTISRYLSQGKLHKVSNGTREGIAKAELDKYRA